MILSCIDGGLICVPTIVFILSALGLGGWVKLKCKKHKHCNGNHKRRVWFED